MVPNVFVRRIGFYECRDFNLALFRGVLRFSYCLASRVSRSKSLRSLGRKLKRRFRFGLSSAGRGCTNALRFSFCLASNASSSTTSEPPSRAKSALLSVLPVVVGAKQAFSAFLKKRLPIRVRLNRLKGNPD